MGPSNPPMTYADRSMKSQIFFPQMTQTSTICSIPNFLPIHKSINHEKIQVVFNFSFH